MLDSANMPPDFGTLLGQEVIFGRLVDGRNTNFLSLYRFTIGIDGSISGPHRDNESRYVLSHRLPTLLDHNGRPTARFHSCWTHDPRVLIGDSADGRRKQFLYTFNSLKQRHKRILYLVASNVRYTQPLQVLLHQLTLAGIERTSLWVTISDSTRDEVVHNDGIAFSHLSENAYEYLALLDVIRHDLVFDYVFLIHDTCYVGSRFKHSVESQPCTIPWDYMSLGAKGQFNIGLYSRSFLQNMRPFLESLIGVSKQDGIDVELNRNESGFKSKAAITTNFVDVTRKEVGASFEFGSSVERQGVYFEGADLYKFYRIRGATDIP